MTALAKSFAEGFAAFDAGSGAKRLSGSAQCWRTIRMTVLPNIRQACRQLHPWHGAPRSSECQLTSLTVAARKESRRLPGQEKIAPPFVVTKRGNGFKRTGPSRVGIIKPVASGRPSPVTGPARRPSHGKRDWQARSVERTRIGDRCRHLDT